MESAIVSANGRTDQQNHLTSARKQEVKDIVKEWHLKLGHPSAARLVATMN